MEQEMKFCQSCGMPLTKDILGTNTAGYTVKSGPRTTGDGYYESVIALWDGIELEITI